MGHDNPPPGDMHSRGRAGRQPDPDIAALRALKRATEDYLLVLEAGYAALTNDAIEGKPTLAYIRSMLAVATGHRGSGGFGTPSVSATCSAARWARRR